MSSGTPPSPPDGLPALAANPPPDPSPQASLSGLLFPGQDSQRHTHYHPPGFLTCGLAGSCEGQGRELMGCLNWALGCANMALRPGVSPGMCPRLQAPRLHSLRCSQPCLQVQAGGGRGNLAWGVANAQAEPQLEDHSWKNAAYCPPPEFWGSLLLFSLFREIWRKHAQSEVTWHLVFGLQRKRC